LGFANVRKLADAIEDNGQNWTSWFHKTSGPTGFGAGRWADMSMGAGTPKYNAYVGSQLQATPLINQGNDGIYLGPSPAAGMSKFITGLQLQSAVTNLAPSSWVLCDYLMFYPLVDGDSTDQQDMDNTALLPRYADGDGVMAMVVCTTPAASDAPCTFTYTNSDGVAGRTVTTMLSFTNVTGCIMSTTANVASTNARAAFLPLANGDRGVRAIESAALLSALGGFFAIVLVKPMTTAVLPENVVACESTELIHKARVRKVDAGAYLNFIYCPLGAGSGAFPLRGHIQFAWS
jgi:hypothetical protein